MSHEILMERSRTRWACDVLRLPFDVAPDDAQRAMFDRIREQGFEPEPATREAIEVVQGRILEDASLMTRSEWQRFVHESLRREIEQFAGRFFGLDQRSRENEWRALHDRAKDFPRLQGRLERLQPGLAIPSQIPPGASPEVERHIRGLMAVFVASPTKRHEAIREAGFDLPRPQMRKLARFVRRTLPEFATLEPALVDRLTRDEPARTGPEITVSTSSGVTGPRSDSQNYLPVALFISLAILFFRAVSAFSPANRAEERPTAIAAPPFSSPERLPGYRTAESARETSQRLEKWQQEQRRERQALQQRRLDELKKRTSPQRKAVDTEEPAIAEIPEPPRKDPVRGDSVLRQLLELRGRMDQILRRLEKKEASDEQGRSKF